MELSEKDLHVLGRRHAISVLAALTSKECRDGLQFTKIASGLVRNPGQASSILQSLEEQLFVEKNHKTREAKYRATARGQAAFDALRPHVDRAVLGRVEQFVALLQEERRAALALPTVESRSGPLNGSRGPDRDAG